MSTRRVVHVVVPEGLDDLRRPSGGNVYDRRVCTGLAEAGWTVHEHGAVGAWPHPSPADQKALGDLLDEVPDGSRVLVDGLVASAAPDLVGRQADRLCLVVLVHLPLGVRAPSRRAAEGRMLARVTSVIATSAWCASWLTEHYARLGLDATPIHLAVPGTDRADPAVGTASGGALLCVGAVTPVKGHDVLLDALTRIAHLDWRMTWAGALDLEPGFVRLLRERAEDSGLADRLALTGPLTGDGLHAVYRSADALVVASRIETYGMAATEALARGVPVIACRTGGISESVGTGAGEVPGLLVPPADPVALASAIASWLGDPAVRTRARRAAAARRATLPVWPETVARVAEVLSAR